MVGKTFQVSIYILQRDNATFLGGGGYKLQQFSEIYVVPAIATRWQLKKLILLMGLGGKLMLHYHICLS